MSRTPLRRTGRLLSAALAGVLACLVAGPASAEPVRAPRTVAEGAWWYDVMGIDEAHEKATGEGATIALIDGPYNTSVPELQGADLRLMTGCDGRRTRPYDGPGAAHGTSQAALLLGNGRGNGEGGAGIRGIVPDATVLAYDWDREPEKKHLQCSTAALSAMFDDAVRRGADVISVAGTLGDGIAAAARRAIDAGVIVVGAAGAKGSLGSEMPADLEGAVSVYAVDAQARQWKGQTSFGFPVVCAPGVYVGTGGYYGGSWTSNAWATGTSPATTITAGALALVKSAYPDATGNQLLQHLIHHTGGDVPYSWDEEFGFGIVSVREMLRTDPGQWPDENPLGKVLADAVQEYPMSASSLVEGDGPSASPSERATEPAGDSANDATGAGQTDPVAGDSAADEASTGPGLGVWVALAVLLLLVAGAVLMRGRGRRTTGPRGTEPGGE